jgi:chloride channel 3/4/5
MSASSSNSHSNQAAAVSSRNPYKSSATPLDNNIDDDASFVDHERDVIHTTSNSNSNSNTLPYLNTFAVAHDAKDHAALDYHVEGPGRRVGYDNLTAIDWIFEYAKERQRLKVLRSNAVGLLGSFQSIADSSHTWIILVATGVAVGAIAAAIDITSGWLGDLKAGYCSNVQDGGKFYLNKGFCCWGQKDYESCPDWRSWSSAMTVTSSAGSWFIDFILYLAYSVRLHMHILHDQPETCNTDSLRSYLPRLPHFLSPNTRSLPSKVVYLK